VTQIGGLQALVVLSVALLVIAAGLFVFAWFYWSVLR